MYEIICISVEVCVYYIAALWCRIKIFIFFFLCSSLLLLEVESFAPLLIFWYRDWFRACHAEHLAYMGRSIYCHMTNLQNFFKKTFLWNGTVFETNQTFVASMLKFIILIILLVPSSLEDRKWTIVQSADDSFFRCIKPHKEKMELLIASKTFRSLKYRLSIIAT